MTNNPDIAALRERIDALIAEGRQPQPGRQQGRWAYAMWELLCDCQKALSAPQPNVAALIERLRTQWIGTPQANEQAIALMAHTADALAALSPAAQVPRELTKEMHLAMLQARQSEGGYADMWRAAYDAAISPAASEETAQFRSDWHRAMDEIAQMRVELARAKPVIEHARASAEDADDGDLSPFVQKRLMRLREAIRAYDKGEG